MSTYESRSSPGQLGHDLRLARLQILARNRYEALNVPKSGMYFDCYRLPREKIGKQSQFCFVARLDGDPFEMRLPDDSGSSAARALQEALRFYSARGNTVFCVCVDGGSLFASSMFESLCAARGLEIRYGRRWHLLAAGARATKRSRS